MGGSASFGYDKSDANNQAQSTQNSYGYNTSAGGQQATSGQSVWGPQQDALVQQYGQASSIFGGTNPYAQQAQGIGQQGQAAWGQQLTPGSSPYFDQAVQASIDQATDSFKRQVLPGLVDQGVSAGGLGGSRQALASGEASGIFGAGLAQQAAMQRSAQYTADQNRALQAVGMTPQFQQGAFAPLDMARMLIGGPTTLSSSQSTGWQQALGEQLSAGQSTSAGQSSSRGYRTSGGGGLKGG